MKLSVKPQHLKFLILGIGGIGLLLRLILYITGTDAKGLLVSGHWAGWALGILTLCAIVTVLYLTRNLEGSPRYSDAYPVSVVSAAGCFLLAVMLVITTVSEMGDSALPLSNLMTVLGFGAAAALCFIGACRMMGMKPLFLFHGVLCIYFAMRMVYEYRYWSADPQLLDYCFYLGAYLGLMLTGYHHAAFDADMGNHRKLWRFSLLTVFLCCLSVKGYKDTLLLYAGGVWAFTNLTCLTVRPRRQRRAMVLDQEAAPEE